MAERRSAHRTQWAAQFAVASELCKRGYEVALTMGNHRDKDLLVVSPNDVSFAIDVKGLYKQNYWAVGVKDKRPGLFYVFAYVPDDAPNEFFVLKQETVNGLIQDHLAEIRARKIAKGEPTDKADHFPGIPWKRLLPFKNLWKETLPA